MHGDVFAGGRRKHSVVSEGPSGTCSEHQSTQIHELQRALTAFGEAMAGVAQVSWFHAVFSVEMLFEFPAQGHPQGRWH